MQTVNSIATTEAHLADGSLVAYRDCDPSHIRDARFRHILDHDPLLFTVTTTDGAVFAVDLVDGSLSVDERRFTPTPQSTKLRLVYYKRMHADTGGSGPVMEFFVVGWQTTTEAGRNERIGIKVFPDQLRWEITNDI